MARKLEKISFEQFQKDISNNKKVYESYLFQCARQNIVQVTILR